MDSTSKYLARLLGDAASIDTMPIGESALVRPRRRRRNRPVPRAQLYPSLDEEQILAWADAHHHRTGEWPAIRSGQVSEAPLENWMALDRALRKGSRALAGGSSLARLLAARRGVRNPSALPRFTEEQILEWADAHRAREGEFPRQHSGLIEGTDGDAWRVVDDALLKGQRGLPGGTTLAQLLAARRNVPTRYGRPSLTFDRMLAWADAHHHRTGEWPTTRSGQVSEAPLENWRALDRALSKGNRGLAGGSSLARLLAARRGVRNRSAPPRLTEEQILEWADAHRARWGKFPRQHSGPIEGTDGDTWGRVDNALMRGQRGLPGGTTLAQLLAARRRVPTRYGRPSLTFDRILAWADEHCTRTGRWPTAGDGQVAGVPGESWSAIDSALNAGVRGLAGGSSLARLLAAERGVRNRKDVPALTVALILGWMDAHRARTGEWPAPSSGPIADAPGETWTAIHIALNRGTRGLPGGSSLPKLLAASRGVRNLGELPPFTEAQILLWARAHCTRTGKWPAEESGAVTDAPEENWRSLSQALRIGTRGLPGGSSLARLLAAQLQVRNQRAQPPLTVCGILDWADQHRLGTGRFPTGNSGPILGAPGETWQRVNDALRDGYRGLPGGSSLARLLAEHRAVRYRKGLSPHSEEEILAWADGHFRRTGRRPTAHSGPVQDAPGETWSAINGALEQGLRGLPGGDSLARLLARREGRAEGRRNRRRNE